MDTSSVVRAYGADEAGEIVELRCSYDPESRGGTPADGRKVAGTIHWVSAEQSLPAEVRLYDRLFGDEQPDQGKGGEDFKKSLNRDSLSTLKGARVESSLGSADPGARFQFERLGYFYLDPEASRGGRPVFNRIVTLRDTWAKLSGSKAGEASARRSRGESKSVGPAVVHDPLAGLGSEELERLRGLTGTYGLTNADARILLDDAPLLTFYEAASNGHENPIGSCALGGQ